MLPQLVVVAAVVRFSIGELLAGGCDGRLPLVVVVFGSFVVEALVFLIVVEVGTGPF